MARLTAANQVLDEAQGRSVDPLQIVEKQHQWALGPGEYAQERAKRHLEAVARVLWREGRQPRVFADNQLQFGDETGDELAVWAYGVLDGSAPARELRFAAAQDHPHEAVQCLGERRVRDITAGLIALSRGEDALRQTGRALQLVDNR